MEGHLSSVCALIVVLGAIGLSGAHHTVKAGMCPWFNKTALCSKHVPHQCFHDGQCKDKAKCCFNGCRRVCVQPRQVKSGVCPWFDQNTPGPCSPVVTHQCSYDDDCPNNDKCCFNGCGRVCREPRTVKSGVCPWFTKPAMCPALANECSYDDQCPNNNKCCHDGCRRVCRAPQNVKDGACPALHWNALVKDVAAVDHRCDYDNNCDNNQKCCFKGCTRVCAAPTKAKHGECPSWSWLRNAKCARHVRHRCSSDYHCRGDHKCCYNGCSRVCVSPNKGKVKSGVCPNTSFNAHRKCFHVKHQCNYDYDCGGASKCCHNGCSRVCVAPQKVKSGVCPISPWYGDRKCLHAKHECSNDFQCSGHLKCCYRGCERVCSAPNTGSVKSGLCPCLTWSRHGQSSTVSHQCSNDNGCPGTQKCCYRGYERVCTEPHRVKSGFCPRIVWSNGGHVHQKCSRDDDCEGNHKCCYRGHERVCSPPHENCKFPHHKCFQNKRCSKDSHCGRHKCCKGRCCIPLIHGK
ncbi:unnamed protein product [Ophioblennius macclurei]